MKKLFNDKIMNVLVFILILEMILGGLGKTFYLPIRITIFAVALVYSLLYIKINNIAIKKEYYIYIGIIMGYAILGSVIGLLRGNNIRNIVADANVFVTTLYVIILAAYINNNIMKLNKITNLVVIFAVLIAIVTSVMYFGSHLYLRNGYNIVVDFDAAEKFLNIGLISGLLYHNQFARVYFTSGIFMEVALAICLVRAAKSNEGKFISYDTIAIAILSLGIFASSTRGYWVGAGVVVALTILFVKCDKKALAKSLVLTILVLGSVYVLYPRNVRDQLSKRLVSTTEFTENKVDLSNSVRKTQFNHLVSKIKEKPIIGFGFGGQIPEYEQETGRGPMNFELYYLELVFKTGIVGFLALLAILIYIARDYIRALKNPINFQLQYLVIGWGIAFLAVFVSGGTNPYLAGAHGFFVVIMLLTAICESDKGLAIK